MKYTLVGLLAISFLTLFSVLAMGSKQRVPTIEKMIFIHYEASTPPPWVLERWDATEDDFRLIAGGVKWHEWNIPYEINPTGVLTHPHNLTWSNVSDAINQSAHTWNSVTTVGNVFTYEATRNNTGVVGFNGLNTIVWAPLSPGVIAVTYLWYFNHNKTMIEFDMIFNNATYTWQIWPHNTTTDYMDVQNIATHEFGHNGLDDLMAPKDWKLTMYTYSYKGEIDKRTLGYGDELGWQELYSLISG
jgi:hypothetical protein